MDWFSVLQAVRRVAAKKEVFNSTDVAEEAGIEGTDRSEPHQIASAWLGKLCRWGYVLRAGREPGERSWRGYRLTDWGRRFTHAKGKRSKR